jgi:hypothetical protein
MSYLFQDERRVVPTRVLGLRVDDKNCFDRLASHYGIKSLGIPILVWLVQFTQDIVEFELTLLSVSSIAHGQLEESQRISFPSDTASLDFKTVLYSLNLKRAIPLYLYHSFSLSRLIYLPSMSL